MVCMHTRQLHQAVQWTLTADQDITCLASNDKHKPWTCTAASDAGLVLAAQPHLRLLCEAERLFDPLSCGQRCETLIRLQTACIHLQRSIQDLTDL